MLRGFCVLPERPALAVYRVDADRRQRSGRFRDGKCPHEIRHWDDEPAMCDKGGVFSCAENLSLEFHRGEQHLEDVTAGIRPLVLVRSDVGHSQAEDDEVFAGRYYERFARDGSVRENS